MSGGYWKELPASWQKRERKIQKTRKDKKMTLYTNARNLKDLNRQRKAEGEYEIRYYDFVNKRRAYNMFNEDGTCVAEYFYIQYASDLTYYNDGKDFFGKDF
jgi:hypothetical protein